MRDGEERLGIFVLLDFLTGRSLSDAVRIHGLASTNDAERLLRRVLLEHGYAAYADRGESFRGRPRG